VFTDPFWKAKIGGVEERRYEKSVTTTAARDDGGKAEVEWWVWS
jgi:hypothetical protein